MLTSEQRSQLRQYLEAQGLSFKPLQDEMVDHMSCELESRMADGHSFHAAWKQTIGDIPDNHFQLIQNDVMETINKRFTWSQSFSLLALALLLMSTLFKVLHLTGAGEILLLSFTLIAASLLTTTVSGIFLNKRKKGATRVMGIVLGMTLLLISFGFRILHLQGADGTLFLAVGLLVTFLVVNTVYVYRHASGEGNLLTYLHEKYTPAIERFLMFLLLPLVVYKVLSIVLNTNDFVGNMVLLVAIFGAGLQLIALSWRIMEKNLTKRNPRVLSCIIICCLCLVLPFLGPVLPLTVRIALVALFSPVAAWLAYTLEMESGKKRFLALIVGVPLLFVGWALIKVQVISYELHWIFFNLPVLFILTAALVVCKRHLMIRAWLLISIGGYVFEYLK